MGARPAGSVGLASSILQFGGNRNMLSKVVSSATHGVDAYRVEVEADIQQQLPAFITVGLPEGAVR